MSLLITCSVCRRHLRRTEATCPFCAAPVTSNSDAPLARAARLRPLNRAALFALGLSLVGSACEDNAVPIYGAPIPPAGSGGVSNGSVGGGAGRAGAGGNTTAGAAGADDSARDAAAGDAEARDADSADE